LPTPEMVLQPARTSAAIARAIAFFIIVPVVSWFCNDLKMIRLSPGIFS
jgi:hypothetical protein